MTSKKSILVVCVGNICRSPMAEYKLKSLSTDWHIESSGLSAVVGSGACETATAVAGEYGISIAGHTAKQFHVEHALSFSLILAMEGCHVDAITQLCPVLKGRTYLLGKWNNVQSIADPYRKKREQYQTAFRAIEQSTEKWAEMVGMEIAA